MRSTLPLGLLAAALIAASASAQASLSLGTGTFLDISGTGTVLIGAGDDTVHGFTSTVGNDLFPAGPVVVTSNGYIVSGAVPSNSVFTNAQIVATSDGSTAGYPAASKVICPFWDDLYALGASNATLYWQEISGVLYIQFQNIGHFPTSSAAGGPGITFQVQIFQFALCTTDRINMVYPDTTFGGVQAANDAGASATVGYIGGSAADNLQWCFNVPSVPSGTSLTIAKPPPWTLAWSSPLGAGSLFMAVCGGSPNGQYQLVATVNAGVFPNGWLYGIDITYPELLAQLGAFPFKGPLNGSGGATLGAFTGLPGGLSIYSVVFNIPPGSVPTVHTNPNVYTIP